ncbi:HAAS domain-containing protein [Williamsoniiplasma lucivorax]|uniref:DUF1700 domain-containing protein n=1 Tax=Williamsoniiplasma lucivorax TaxID=209274 RepID=A0A2S5RFA2_9MOLU|nr:DUF1700 domain-containing protein [Williamsoniiplasma lucivorax]PPE05993.1 hypothetical protein ELUCI_v1c02840 [Williamsoniiplasma lucivorax]
MKIIKSKKQSNKWLRDLEKHIALLKPEYQEEIISIYSDYFEENIKEGNEFNDLISDAKPIEVLVKNLYKKYNIDPESLNRDARTKKQKFLNAFSLFLQPFILLGGIALIILAVLTPVASFFVATLLYLNFDFWEASSITWITIPGTPLLLVSFLFIAKLLFKYSNKTLNYFGLAYWNKKLQKIKWKKWLIRFCVSIAFFATFLAIIFIVNPNQSLIKYAKSDQLKNVQTFNINKILDQEHWNKDLKLETTYGESTFSIERAGINNEYKKGTLVRRHNFKNNIGENKYIFDEKNLIIKVEPDNWAQKYFIFGIEKYTLYI